MGDIVNLNKYRKVRQKADRRQLVAVNRQKFARPKADLVKLEADRGSAARALDGHVLDRKSGGGTLDDRAPGNRAPGNRAPGNRASGNRASGNRASDNRPSGGPQSDDDGAPDGRPGAPRETD